VSVRALYIRSAYISSFCVTLVGNKSGGKEEHLRWPLTTLDYSQDQKHQKGAKKCQITQKQKIFEKLSPAALSSLSPKKRNK